MKTFTTKIRTAMVLIAVLLLTTVGISAQSYQDDVYYSPSKDTSKKKVVKRPDARKEVKKTYRPVDKAEDFSSAQKRYAKMLREKKGESTTTYGSSESWIYSTQGLTNKQDIRKEISLYNKGNVSADKTQVVNCDREYVLWQPETITRIYTRPYWSSRSYINFGWGSMYYHPYYAYNYDAPFFWDDFYYWNSAPYYYSHSYSPYYRWHTPYFWHHSYYGPLAWGNYYNPYYDNYYYDNYYRNHYYHSREVHRKRPTEFSDRSNNVYRRNYNGTQHHRTTTLRNRTTVRQPSASSRYSSNAYRRKISNKSNLYKTNFRRANQATTPSTMNSSTTRRAPNTILHQGKSPYTRRIKNTGITYRRRSTQEYRRIQEHSTIRRNSPSTTTYRKTSVTPRRSPNSSSSHRRSAPNNNRSNYSPSYRNTSPRRSPSSYSSPSRRSSSKTTPRRSNLGSRNRR